jgi:hypothetical protein
MLHPLKRAIATAGMAIMLVLPGAASISAQESDLVPPEMTAVSDVQPVPIEACDVDPANPDRVLEIVGDAVDDPSAVLDSSATPVPAGTDVVTGDDADAVVALGYQFIACLNANDLLRATSLLSDDLLKRAAYDIAGSIQDLDEGTPEPVDEEYRNAITKTSDVTRLDDGRLVYSMGIGYVYPEDQNEYVTDSYFQIVAVEQGGEWKIDDLRFYEEPGEPSCGGSDGADGCLPPESGTYITEDGYHGYILSTELMQDTAAYFLDTDNADATPFVPTEAMVAEAEAALPAYVATAPRVTDRIIDELASFERQYLGFETNAGPVLVINALCEPGFDTANGVVIVMDGGDCFWQATYDLTTHAFTHFSVNGDA